MDKFYPNSFDNSVKSAFEKADDELNSSGNWDAMQQVLDREMPVEKKKRRFFFWFVIAVLLLGTVGYQYWKANLENAKAVIKVEVKTIPSASGNRTSVANLDSNEKPILDKNHVSSENKTSVGSLGSSITKNVDDFLSTNENKNVAEIQKLNSLKSSVQVKDEFAFSNEVKQPNQIRAEEKEILEKENIVISIGKKDTVKLDTDLIKPLPVDTITPIAIKTEPPKSLLRQQTKWQWNLSFAPDFLLANIQPFYRPGVSMGLGINYQLSPRWAIRTGLLYNYTPIYESGETYIFKPSPNLPAYNTLELKQVRGNLHVFEVPLSARFTATPNKKLSFMGSVGLSSLFFVKQNLTYDLLLNGNSPLSWNSENDSDDFGESHILSNLVIGTGISIKTKRNAVVELEPVFKLPLEELGEGHNKLGTIAIYLHLKQPIFKQKK